MGERESLTVIDHVLAAPGVEARLESTDTVDGLEQCSHGGHCHRAIVSVVRRLPAPPAEGTDWRWPAGQVCKGTREEHEACLRGYGAALGPVYERLLRARQQRWGGAAGRAAPRPGEVAVCNLDAADGPRACAKAGGHVNAGRTTAIGNPFQMRIVSRGKVCLAHARLLRRVDEARGGRGGKKPGLAVEMAAEEDAARDGGLGLGRLGDSVHGAFRTSESDVLRWHALLGIAERLADGENIELGCHCEPQECHARSLSLWLRRRADDGLPSGRHVQRSDLYSSHICRYFIPLCAIF